MSAGMVQWLVLWKLTMVVGTGWIGISFSLLYFRIGGSVSFLLHVSFPTGDEKVDHVDTKCIFICTSVGWVRGTVGSCMLQVFFTMAGF